jgi:two-component system, chemotaxis family, CheB/CheR fusion protein
MMAELLQRTTNMKVFVVSDGMQCKPNCVYVIPPNKSMSILNKVLHLFNPVEERGLRLPIDFFFRSLADDMKEKSVGIMLSGMGSDGSLGVKAIKERAGIVMVQDPSNAKFDSMPRSALEAVVADIIAPVGELAAKLQKVSDVVFRKANVLSFDKDNSSWDKIIILLRTQTGNDFSQYKKSTVYRRIERRMGIHQIDKIASYVQYLQENPSELQILFKELLIGVTSFFRDTYVWEYLKNVILPALLTDLPKGYIIRAWIPACSTGEEAYSLAIIFRETVEKLKLNKSISLQIFATDLDGAAIEQARKGIYPENVVNDVSDSRLGRFFQKADNMYRINTDIREMIIFAYQNVIKDAPFTKLDIISCRNMLIYMNSDLQRKLISLFHYSLNKNGALILGNAETIGDQKELFSLTDSKTHIYNSIGAPRVDELLDFPSSFAQTRIRTSEIQNVPKVTENLETLISTLLLQQYSPASVLVTDQGDILFLTGKIEKYLTLSAGKANMNLFSMAREGLRNQIHIAFRKVLRNYDCIIIQNLKVESVRGSIFVNISLQQIENPIGLRGKIIVVFSDVPEDGPSDLKLRKGESRDLTAKIDFEQELQRLNEELQSTREEMQTSQEELKSTNEELQSSNEELQSTNEELTTSKEEMQSLNEELHTINIELQNKIDDSMNIKNDMINLINSSEIATLFLNRELKIRHYTIEATKIFKFIQSDLGRPFNDVVSNLNYSDMENDIKSVLRTLIYTEREITAKNGLSFKIRIMPYRTLDDKIDGVVITFIDITKAKKLENALKGALELVNSNFIYLSNPAILLSAEGKILEINPSAVNAFGYEAKNICGKEYSEILITEKTHVKAQTEFGRISSGPLPCRIKNVILMSNGGTTPIEWTANRIYDDKGSEKGFILIAENS